MKHLFIKLLIPLCGGLLFVSHTAKAQEFESIFRGGPEDAEQYLESYGEGLMLSFNNGLSGGWYNTAKTHKILGFDLTATVNIANVPSESQSFTFNNSDYQILELANGTSAQLPSAVGGPTDVMLQVSASQTITDPNGGSVTYEETKVFAAPDGFDLDDSPISGFPVPALQLGVGLPKNTDLILRYASDFGAAGDDGSFNLFGIGVKHDLKQWIPGLKQVPFDLAGFVAYNQLNAEYDILISQNDNGESFDADGTIETKASALIIQGIISKKFSILTPYVGVGYSAASSSLDVKGTYEYRDDADNEIATFEDPLSLDFSGGSTPRINAGLRIKLLILTLHAEYAIQKYNTFTLGAGISIR